MELELGIQGRVQVGLEELRSRANQLRRWQNRLGDLTSVCCSRVKTLLQLWEKRRCVKMWREDLEWEERMSNRQVERSASGPLRNR